MNHYIIYALIVGSIAILTFVIFSKNKNFVPGNFMSIINAPRQQNLNNLIIDEKGNNYFIREKKKKVDPAYSNYAVILIGTEEKHSKFFVPKDDVPMFFNKESTLYRWIDRKIDLSRLAAQHANYKIRWSIKPGEEEYINKYFFSGYILTEHMKGHENYSRRMFAKENVPPQLKPYFYRIKGYKHKHDFIRDDKLINSYVEKGHVPQIVSLRPAVIELQKKYDLTGEELWEFHKITKGHVSKKETEKFYNDIAPKLNHTRKLTDFTK